MYSVVNSSKCNMLLFHVLVFLGTCKFSVSQDISNVEDIKVLSELPLEKLLSISKDFVVDDIENEINSTYDDELESRELPHALALKGKVKLKDRGGHGGGSNYHQPTYVYEEYYEKDGKSKKIQSIFQLSVTSLAFLAFGGYLLCLLIHAIKAKQQYATNPAATQALATFLATRLRRIKNQNKFRKRRKNLKLHGKPNLVRRPNNLQQQKRPNRYQTVRGNTTTKLKVQKKPSNTPGTVYVMYTGNKSVKRQPRPKRDVIGSAGGYIVYDDMYYALLDLSEAYTKYHTVDYLRYNTTTFNG